MKNFLAAVGVASLAYWGYKGYQQCLAEPMSQLATNEAVRRANLIHAQEAARRQAADRQNRSSID